MGTTTLAVNVAVALRKRDAGRVALFDTAFSFGDVAVHMDLRAGKGIAELVQQLEDLDEPNTDQIMRAHSSGLRVLLGPPTPEQGELVTAAHVERAMKYLAEVYDIVIVDCPTTYDDRTLTVLEHADDIMLITTPEISAIRNTGNFIDLAMRLKLPLKKVHVVLNRANSNTHIGVPEIERILRHAIAFQTQSSGRALLRSVTRGVPLVVEQPQHPLSIEFGDIANKLLGLAPIPAQLPSGSRLLVKLANRERQGSDYEAPPTDSASPPPAPPPAPKGRLQGLWQQFWKWLTGVPTQT